jgi:WD40 repeat protein
METGRAIHVLGDHAGTVYCVAWSPDGNLIASGSADTTIRIWNTQSGQLVDIRTHLGTVALTRELQHVVRLVSVGYPTSCGLDC